MPPWDNLVGVGNPAGSWPMLLHVEQVESGRLNNRWKEWLQSWSHQIWVSSCVTLRPSWSGFLQERVSQELPKGTKWPRRFAPGAFNRPIGKDVLTWAAEKGICIYNDSEYSLDSLVKSLSEWQLVYHSFLVKNASEEIVMMPLTSVGYILIGDRNAPIQNHILLEGISGSNENTSL